MPHPTRTIVLLMVFAIGGLSVLGFLAYRYSRLLEGSIVTTEAAVRQVEEFIQVRRAMVREIEAGRVDREGSRALLVARDRALALRGIESESYIETRRLFRSWREGRLRAGSPVASALEQRRSDLQTVDLGVYEPLDS